jgi:uncharacterized protein YdeI (YjbR/CyaY-like superfamily)
MNPSVEQYIGSKDQWQQELECLRGIVLECNLQEEFKWSIPVYTYRGKNIIGLGRFKNYCVLAFFKGALLSDSEKLMVRPGSVQAARFIRFASVQEIVKKESVIKAYIFEAIEVEKAGLKVPKKKSSDYPVPIEFQNKLDEMPALKKAFNALTPGRQRAYIVYFSAPKQAKTRSARVEKCIKQILSGKGLDY